MWHDGQPTCIGGIIKDISDRVAAAREHSDADDLVSALTKREREVLTCLVGGAANKNIAYALGLSQRTVEGYRARLMDKMLVRSVAELVKVALAAGVTSPGAKA
jgi:two-component system response regulator FixJ